MSLPDAHANGSIWLVRALVGLLGAASLGILTLWADNLTDAQAAFFSTTSAAITRLSDRTLENAARTHEVQVDLERRIGAVRAEMPTREDISRLSRQIERLTERLDGIDG